MSYPPSQGYGAPGGYPPQGGYGPGPTPVVVQSNGLATGALVTGIISMLCFPALFIVAIPLGFAGLSKANKMHGAGRGQAIGGLVTGFFGLLWVVVLGAMLILGAGFFATQVDDLTCSLNRTSLETAVEAFQAAEGRDPADEAELVTEGYLTDEADTHDFTISNGTVTVEATSGEGCD